MQFPLITIGMTCYNAADTIGRAIDGALRQDYPFFEIVIVDDGSKDESRAIIQEKANADSRIRFIPHEQNKGFPAALNTLIAHAQGEYIAIFDDDDESHANRIRVQYETLRAYEEKTGVNYVACYASLQKKYPNGYSVALPAVGSVPDVPVGDDMVRYHLSLDRRPSVFYGGGTPSCALMARKATFDAVGPYDVHLRRNEDCDFAIRLGVLGGHFIGTTDYVLTQFASVGADKKPEIAYNSELALVEKYKNILDQYGRYDYARDWLRVRYLHFSGQKSAAVLHVLKMILKYPVLTITRFLRAAPRRLAHERRMRKDAE